MWYKENEKRKQRRRRKIKLRASYTKPLTKTYPETLKRVDSPKESRMGLAPLVSIPPCWNACHSPQPMVISPRSLPIPSHPRNNLLDLRNMIISPLCLNSPTIPIQLWSPTEHVWKLPSRWLSDCLSGETNWSTVEQDHKTKLLSGKHPKKKKKNL